MRANVQKIGQPVEAVVRELEKILFTYYGLLLICPFHGCFSLGFVQQRAITDCESSYFYKSRHKFINLHNIYTL